MKAVLSPRTARQVRQPAKVLIPSMSAKFPVRLTAREHCLSPASPPVRQPVCPSISQPGRQRLSVQLPLQPGIRQPVFPTHLTKSLSEDSRVMVPSTETARTTGACEARPFASVEVPTTPPPPPRARPQARAKAVSPTLPSHLRLEDHLCRGGSKACRQGCRYLLTRPPRRS
ncbi:unnamed protein product [Arctogadus glacialis]